MHEGSAALELLGHVDRGSSVLPKDRGRLCAPAVLTYMANEMSESWLRTRLVAGVCGLTGSRTQPWLLLPTRRESASRLLAHMSEGTDLCRVMIHALDVRSADWDAWQRLAEGVRSGRFGDSDELCDAMRKFVNCDARVFVSRKMNRKQLAHVPEARLRVMVKGAERLQRRLRRVLEFLETPSKKRLPSGGTAQLAATAVTSAPAVAAVAAESARPHRRFPVAVVAGVVVAVAVVVALFVTAVMAWSRRRGGGGGARGDVEEEEEVSERRKRDAPAGRVELPTVGLKVQRSDQLS